MDIKGLYCILYSDLTCGCIVKNTGEGECVVLSNVTSVFCWEETEEWPNAGRTRENSPSPSSDVNNISLFRVSGVFLTDETPGMRSVVSRWVGVSALDLTDLCGSVPVFLRHSCSDTGTWRRCEDTGDGSVESGLGVWLDGGGFATSSFWMFSVIAETGFCSLSDR